MRGCLGVVAGLIIGVAMSFAVLAVAISSGGGGAACAATAPVGWLIRVVIPWADISREVSSTSVPAAGGVLTVDKVSPAPCGRVQVEATWERAGTQVRGIGMVLEGTPGAQELRPIDLLLGRLQVPLQWAPRSWLDRLAGPISHAGGAALARGLQGDGTELCGLVGLQEGLALFLCAADD